MKEINVKVIGQEGNVSSDPMKGTLIIESDYRLIEQPRFIEAVEKSIISMVEKIEDEVSEWVSERISGLVSGKTIKEEFIIGNNAYFLSLK